jgi:hypothetical protein
MGPYGYRDTMPMQLVFLRPAVVLENVVYPS